MQPPDSSWASEGNFRMHIGVLALDFHLEGCRSLKEKRHRLSRLRERFGRKPHLAVCESGHQDSHRQARWQVVATADSLRVVEQSLAEVENWVAMSMDATLTGVDREVLR